MSALDVILVCNRPIPLSLCHVVLAMRPILLLVLFEKEAPSPPPPPTPALKLWPLDWKSSTLTCHATVPPDSYIPNDTLLNDYWIVRVTLPLFFAKAECVTIQIKAIQQCFRELEQQRNFFWIFVGCWRGGRAGHSQWWRGRRKSTKFCCTRDSHGNSTRRRWRRQPISWHEYWYTAHQGGKVRTVYISFNFLWRYNR